MNSPVRQGPWWSRNSITGLNGVLVFFSPADSTSRLTWFDPTGPELGDIRETGCLEPRLSPDGQRSAATFHRPNFYSTQYHVAADGRILINSVPANYSSPLTLITALDSLIDRR